MKIFKRLCYLIFISSLIVSCPEASTTGGGQSWDGGTTGTASDDKSVSALGTYFVRPSSGGEISITPKVDSDIWYIISNTSGSSQSRPSWNVGGVDANILIPQAKFSFLDNALGNKNPIKVDSDLHSQVIDFDLISNDSNVFEYVNTRATDDKVGSKVQFYDSSRPLTATCKLIRTVDTKLGKRTLVIYEEDGMTSKMNTIPTSSEYKVIADAFLKKGLDNDIFDKLTATFGCDWGKYHSEYGRSFIEKDDKITLLYCDIKRQGDPSGSYIGGYYSNWNFLKNSIMVSGSNERMMVTLHAHVSGGKYLGEGLTTLSHEFQHLIHSQYLDINLSRNRLTSFEEANSATTEMFSSIAESLTAQFISKSCKLEVPGPFCVGANVNLEGYVKIASEKDLSEEIVNGCTTNGRAPYFLYAMDSVDVTTWPENVSSEIILRNYGLVASLGAYLLINYGTGIFSEYINGTKADLAGIVDAINKVHEGSNMTEEKLIADWGTAVMLSKVPNLKTPHAFNREGWYLINGLKVPSINFYNYLNIKNGRSSATAFDLQYYGPMSSTKSTLENMTINPYKVKSGVSAGTKFTATAPTLPEGLVLTVVAVPKN